MESIDFPEANFGLAKNQPQYKTLLVYMDNTDNCEMTCCLKLSPEELEEINKTGCLFLTQVTFGRGYSPIRMSTRNPFLNPIITDKVPADENRTPADKWDSTHFIDSHTTGVHEERGPCINCGKHYEEHFWSTRQCEL